MDAGSLTAPKAKGDAVQAPAGVQDRSHVLAVAGVHTRILLSATIILRRDSIGNLFRPPSVDIVFVARRLAALRQRLCFLHKSGQQLTSLTTFMHFTLPIFSSHKTLLFSLLQKKRLILKTK